MPLPVGWVTAPAEPALSEVEAVLRARASAVLVGPAGVGKTTLARQIAGHAPLTLRITKELLRRLRQHGPKADDTDLVAKCYTSADFREGLEAFLAKRPPQWTGR